ncbi:zinc finger, CCHC-type containing protein [Tanacetum coccineum]
MNVLFLISALSMTLGPDSGRECGVPAELMYSTDYEMFHFCIADSKHDWREGSEQYAWIEKCLTSVDRQKQPWLIFSAHRVLGYSFKNVIGVVVAINDIVLFQGGAVKEVRSIVIDDLEYKRGPEIAFDSREEDMSGVVKLRLEALLNCNDKMIKSTKDMLKSKFDMKDMGLADVILGIKIIRTHNGLVLSQAHYVDKILNTHNAGDSGLARTPIDTSTRPDLAYAVSRLSRYTSNPSVAHWKAMTRVLHYLRYSRDYGLHYDRYPAVIEGYSDANWISDIKDSRSTSGYVFILGGAAISWKSSKQTVIANTMMESEFIALDKCGEEAEWLRQFVEDIPRWTKPVTTISIHCDSQSEIGRAHRTMYNGKSRHIRRQIIRYDNYSQQELSQLTM